MTQATPPTPESRDTGPGRPPVDPAPLPPPAPPGMPGGPGGPGGWGYYPPAPVPPRRRWGWILAVLGLLVLLFFSGLMNLALITEGLFGGGEVGVVETVYADGPPGQRVAIVSVSGLIDEAQARWVREALLALRDRPPHAVVLRVDSPGGTVAASDRIWHELTRFRKDTGLPLVVSMGSIAASGGYYISAPADYIVAERTTITGSIGVIAPFYTVERLLDKIGVTPEVHHSTNATQKGTLSPTHAWGKEERAMLVRLLDDAQARFEQVVAEGRQKVLKPAEVTERATGAPFTAPQALDLKLIDEVGYLEAAIAKAAALAGLPAGAQPRVTLLQPRPGWRIGVVLEAGAQEQVRLPALSGEQVRRWLDDLGTPRLEYRWLGR